MNRYECAIHEVSAGFIDGEISGPRTCYRANRERLTRLSDLLGALIADAVELQDDRRGCS
jgi:hypothetical protein